MAVGFTPDVVRGLLGLTGHLGGHGDCSATVRAVEFLDSLPGSGSDPTR
jgi:hypothetical protein